MRQPTYEFRHQYAGSRIDAHPEERAWRSHFRFKIKRVNAVSTPIEI
jgi:hypothetical protein